MLIMEVRANPHVYHQWKFNQIYTIVVAAVIREKIVVFLQMRKKCVIPWEVLVRVGSP